MQEFLIAEAGRPPFARRNGVFRQHRAAADRDDSSNPAGTASCRLVVGDLGWSELNEASAPASRSPREVKPDMQRANLGGGSIAHGRPFGAAGAG